jgi:hypothetical protein
MAQNRSAFDRVTRNWDNVPCVVNNIDYRKKVEAMEDGADEAAKDYEDTKKKYQDTNTNSWFRPSSYTVTEKLERAQKKERKINLLFNVMNQLQSLTTVQDFDAKINQELQSLDAFAKHDVLDGRTANILNEMYLAIGGKKDNFFPQDLKELIVELADNNSSMETILLPMVYK